jgi:hypothetical protein
LLDEFFGKVNFCLFSGTLKIGTKPFWLCLAWFGQEWGEAGLIRIRRGNDTLLFESLLTAPLIGREKGDFI